MTFSRESEQDIRELSRTVAREFLLPLTDADELQGDAEATVAEKLHRDPSLQETLRVASTRRAYLRSVLGRLAKSMIERRLGERTAGDLFDLPDEKRHLTLEEISDAQSLIESVRTELRPTDSASLALETILGSRPLGRGSTRRRFVEGVQNLSRAVTRALGGEYGEEARAEFLRAVAVLRGHTSAVLPQRFTCFVAAPARSDLDTIRSVLAERHIAPLIAVEQPPHGRTVLEHLSSMIRDADLFLGVLPPQDEQLSPSVLFEVGLALGLPRPVLLLSERDPSDLPQVFRDVVLLRVGVDNREAIGFAVDQAVAAVRMGRPRKPAFTSSPEETEAIGEIASELVAHLDRVRMPDDQELEGAVVRALKASGVSTIVRPSDESTARVDMAIWSDELAPWVGAPLLIEVRSRIPDIERLRALGGQVASYLGESGAQWALVIYGDAPEAVRGELLRPRVPVLFMDVRTFLAGLRVRSFADIVRTLRNEAVHGSRA